MRAFIAVDLPPEAKDELASVQKRLSPAAARMSLARDYHITLKFLGEVSAQQLEMVKSSLSQVRFKKFSAALGSLGVFPSEDRARVVWVGVEPEDDFVQLQKGIDDSIEKLFPKEKNFRPHITLARVKLVSDKKLFAQQLQQVKAKGIGFPVGEFKLKKSTLTREGAVYEDLAVYGSNEKAF